MLLPEMMESVTYSKKDLLREHPGDETRNKAWNQYLINRCLMFGGDVADIYHANVVNCVKMTNKMHSDYLRAALAKRKRFGKWVKPGDQDDIDLVVDTYNCNPTKAKEILKLFSPKQLAELREMRNPGGRVSKRSQNP